MTPLMLFYLALLFTAPMVLSISPPEIVKACQAASGYDGTTATVNFNDPSTVSHEAKCYLACVMKSHKTMNEDGTLNHEKSLEIIDNIAKGDGDKMQRLLNAKEACFAEVQFADDHCQSAFDYLKCKREKEPH